MKLLELRFKNLNSLAKEWAIDFTAPEYAADGIFAITGPTGAGKSTLLDAVCLALYGRTPRLKVISKRTNEIMSRQMGECFAEVTFETLKGRFRCHWSQRRAHKKPNGNLIDAKHEISDTSTNKILESKKRDVAVLVEKITGMDFDRFTRSMLLAQGGFAAFLSAAADQRAPILEQITGTGIYSAISKQVHECQREEQASLELLEAQIGGIRLLSEQETEILKAELIKDQAREKDVQKESEALAQKIQWRLALDSLTMELETIEKEENRLLDTINAFESDRRRLEAAQKASQLDSEYATLIQVRAMQVKEKRSYKGPGTTAGTGKNSGEKKAEQASARQIVATAKTRLKQEQVLITSVRALDLKLSDCHKTIGLAQKEYQQIERQLKKERQAHKKNLSSQKKEVSELAKISDFLRSSPMDSRLISNLTGIKEKIKIIQELIIKKNDKANQLVVAQKRWDTQIRKKKKEEYACGQAQLRKETAAKEKLQADRDLEQILDGRLIREYRAQYEHLLREMAYLNTISNLEDLRHHLKNGKACPLCGSQDHPFARNNIPQKDATHKKIKDLAAFIRKVEDIEKSQAQIIEKENKAASQFAHIEKQLIRVSQEEQRATETCERLKTELNAVVKEYETMRRDLSAILLPYGLSKVDEGDLGSVITALENRMNHVVAQQENKIKIEKKINQFDAELKSLSAVMDTLNKNLVQKSSDIKTLEQQKKILIEDRAELYGKKDPDVEEARLENSLTTAESTLEKIRNDQELLQRHVDQLNHQINTLKTATDERQMNLDTCESGFVQSLDTLSFTNEAMFLSTRLSVDEKQFLLKKAKQLDDQLLDIKARKKDREEKLSMSSAEKKTTRSIEQLKEKITLNRESLRDIGEKAGALKQQLLEDENAKERLKEKTKQVDNQKKECRRWDALHALIGSADGKKFRNFAQGLTFDLMVSHANQQLAKMTDRYLLVRDGLQPLELNILDNYQAGEIRSTKNLSGGESFLVSLCLALGLSNMASRNVRVDSLFLDEGFGTLDETALETALEVLAGLQQEGKLIGVISHVPAIKERIPTQITVEPLSGGNSIVKGPGCRRL